MLSLICILHLILSLLQLLPLILGVDQLFASNGNQTVFPGDDARFLCQFNTSNGLHSPQHFEYRDPGNGSDFLKLETGSPVWKFTFGSTGDTRAGPDIVDILQVSASNHELAIRCSFSEVSFTAFLFVYQPPIISLTRGDYYEIIEQQSLLVVFDTQGYPDPQYAHNYTWYYNGSVIRKSPTLQLASTYLNISNSHRSDQGIYTLSTTTIAGNSSAEFYVNVTFPPEMSGSEEVREFAVEGQNKTLECGRDVVGNPVPSFSWRKIGPENTTTTLPSLSSILTIYNTSRADSGNYSCTVSNSVGSLSVSLLLTVYSPSRAPEWSDVSANATALSLQWRPPVDSQGLSVDLYQISIIHTHSYTTLIRTNISGDVLLRSFSRQSGLNVYPDTNYTVRILAYTLNATIRGLESGPYFVKTLVSAPILSSISAEIIYTYILIQWELYSSGKSNTSVDTYVVVVSRGNLHQNSTLHTRNTKAKFYKFESHSTYVINVYGVRNGSVGEPIGRYLETNSNGLPPHLQFIKTQSSNRTTVSVISNFDEVQSPYITFQTGITCKNPSLYVRNTHVNFYGGILSLSLQVPLQYRDFNCSLFLTNIFGNRTYHFTISHLYNMNFTTATPPHTTLSPKPKTINLPQIISITILIILVLIAFIIACILFAICYFCRRSTIYKTDFVYKRKLSSQSPAVIHTTSKESFEYATMESGEEKIETPDPKSEYNV